MNQPRDDTPWTTQQMRENSSKWTLEGDAKLLLYLEAFSKNLCQKSKATIAKIDAMVSTLDYTQISLANSTNRFHALQHSQFVESRVYEEDILSEPAPKETVAQQQNKVDPAIIAKQAVMCGLKLMENEYVKIPINTNNSEQRSFKYVPKDRYLNRPLPPRIGSKEFLESLNPSESESEGGLGSSRSRSPSVASSQSKSYSPSLTIPVANKCDVSSIKKGNLGHSSEEEDDKISHLTNDSNDKILENSPTFLQKSEDYIPNTNRSAPNVFTDKSEPYSRYNYPILFNDGPPLLDDIYEKDKLKKNDLFDSDIEEDEKLFENKAQANIVTNKNSYIFHGQDISKPKAINLFDEEPPEISPRDVSQNVSKVTNLFEDEDSDDDLFATTSKIKHGNQNKSSAIETNKVVGIFSDKPPEIDSSSMKSKGAIKKKIENVKNNLSDIDDDLFKPDNKIINKLTPNKNKVPQKIKLFEDDDDEINYESNIFAKTSAVDESAKQRSFNLFDDEPPIDFDVSSSTKPANKNENKIDPKKFSLFSDSDNEDIFDSLIKNDEYKITKTLNDPENKTKLESFTETVAKEYKNVIDKSTNKSSETLISSQKSIKVIDIFEDESDLFSTRPDVNNVKISNDIKDIEEIKTNTLPTNEVSTKDAMLPEKSKINITNIGKNLDNAAENVHNISVTDEEKHTIKFPSPKVIDKLENPLKNKDEQINTKNINAKNKTANEIENIFDESEDDDLFQVITKNDITNTLSSKTNYSKSIHEKETPQDNNIKSTDDTKLNRTSNYKTKIVGVFEDPIYRSSVPNESAKKVSQTNLPVNKEEILNTNIIEQHHKKIDPNEQAVKEERKKTLYEEAASNIALFEDEPPADIFEDVTNSKKSGSNNKRITLFDDDEDEPDFFQDLSKASSAGRSKEPFGIGLFDNEPPIDVDFKPKNKKISLNIDSDEELFSGKKTLQNKSGYKAVRDVKQSEKEIQENVHSKIISPVKTNEQKKLSNLTNLNINVSALLPGAKPPSLSKKHAEQNGSPSNYKSVKSILTNNENLQKKVTIGDGVNKNTTKIEVSAKINVIPDNRNGDFVVGTETLHNTAVKERAKIPQKRRLPTRRARQEALRKSLILENSDSEIDSSSQDQNISSDSHNSMDANEKPLASKDSNVKTVDNIPSGLSGIINSAPGQPRTSNDDLKICLRDDQTDSYKSENSNSFEKLSSSQFTSSERSESESINKDILSPSTEEDDIFKIDKAADDDTLKVDEYNSIFNDSDNDIEDLSNDLDNKTQSTKHDKIKTKKEFNLLEALTRNSESKADMDVIVEDILQTDSLFKPTEPEFKPDVVLKSVPENIDIAGSALQKPSERSIINKSNLQIQELDENGLSEATACSNKDLADKLSTLAIDGSAEVINAAKVDKTSKDILFDSDLEEDLFTAKPMPLTKNAQSVSQRGDAKPRSPLLESDGADDLFAGSPRSNVIIKKNRKTDNLFSDTDDDDDLFKVKTIKISKSSTDKVLSNKKPTAPKSASLFGDSDDDDDLFKVPPAKYS